MKIEEKKEEEEDVSIYRSNGCDCAINPSFT